MSPNGPADGPPPAAPETVLGVPPGATEREIDLAWRAYVKRHHPDRGGDAEAFLLGRSARETLLSSIGPAYCTPRSASPVLGAPSRRRLRVRRLRRSLATMFPSLAPPPSRVD